MSLFSSATPKAIAATLAMAVVATSLPSTASADHWRHRGYYGHHHRGGDGGAALAAGVVGLAAGAILGSALAPAPAYAAPPPRAYYAPPPRVYYAPPPRAYYAPRPVYVAPPPVYAAPQPVYRASGDPLVVYGGSVGGPQPWTPEWYLYCESKYRSFDPDSGTFQPYNGPRQLCR
ncbi:BA14K family protein [Afifella sp. IM 167]|uniref:BA14K family protein n=1 Tax=Afifella sp. IM 167 TaxID=2033586 RepID=UPI001CCF5A42|nr:BA14K family protein [Afifella sp. IM 167]MBZ8134925.1 BA14K family protein [Afifella sp. IM 167]